MIVCEAIIIYLLVEKLEVVEFKLKKDTLSKAEQKKWQEKYRCTIPNNFPTKYPNKWLEKWNIFPSKGKILDLATGLGANALYLASQGMNIIAIDIAEDAVLSIKKTAFSRQLKLHLVIADLDSFYLPENYFDGVICFYYLNRKLFSGIKKSLKSGGVFIMQTYLDPQIHDTCSHHRYDLKKEELLVEFDGFEILDYNEQTSFGIALKDDSQLNSTASICARKR